MAWIYWKCCIHARRGYALPGASHTPKKPLDAIPGTGRISPPKRE
ncbi:hypothetical protein ACWFMH_19445 [Bacillus altitudinis]